MTDSLASKLRSAPHDLLVRLGFSKARTSKEELRELIEAGKAVLDVKRMAGSEVLRREAELIDRELLEQLASADVRTWEQYLELRGRLTGFRERWSLGERIIQAAAKAEATLDSAKS